MTDYANGNRADTSDLRLPSAILAMLMVLAVGFIGSHCELTRRVSPMGVTSPQGLGIPVVGAALSFLDDFGLLRSDYRLRLTWPVPHLPGPWRKSASNKRAATTHSILPKTIPAAVSHSPVESSSSLSSAGQVLRSILIYAGQPGRMLASVLGLGAAMALERMQSGGLVNLDPIPNAWSMSRNDDGFGTVFGPLHRFSSVSDKTASDGARTSQASLHRVGGEIHHSFLAAAKSAGLSFRLADQVVKALHGAVNFRRLHPGDRFSVVYGHPGGNDKNKNHPRVLAVRLMTSGHTYRAFWFGAQGDGSGGYFNQQGESLREGMVRAPLHYEYISSPFSYHRLNPITHVVRPHYGVDYAAPTGTPVEAAADGRVIYRGHDRGGYGNLVIIKSFGDYKTYYAHLHRFASNVHAGDHVHEGEIIGYVGATGEATGPHLHFGIQVNGKWVNPRTYPLPHAARIASGEHSKFKERVARLKMALNGATNVRFARK